MTYNWKTGDRAMVTLVAGVDRDGDVRAAITRGTYRYLPASLLSPLPPSITPEAQAVLDGAMAWLETPSNFNPTVFRDAVEAYRAKTDPVGALITQAKQAVGQLRKQDCLTTASLLSEALAAVEASRA